MSRPPDRPRDRDAEGRPRNARPRDALGRPLPPGSADAVPPVPEVALSPAETLATARSLLDAGRAFAAHEVLEARWKAAPDAERDLWQGLAQICVGVTHAQRGNHTGAVRLLRRGADRLVPYAAAPPYGIDVTGVRELADRLAAATPTATAPTATAPTTVPSELTKGLSVLLTIDEH